MVEDLGGGTGNHVCQMLEYWTPPAWHVTIMTQTPPLVRQLPADVDVRVAHRTWYDRFPLAQVRRFMELRRTVRAVRPDIVHTYFFWSIVYGRLLRWLGDISVLVENREDLGFSWGRGSYAILRATRAIPDRIICVAEAVRQVALVREGIDRARTIVVRNGVRLVHGSAADRDAARREFGFRTDDVVIGMVANLPRAVKGGHRLLDAVPAIMAGVPSARFLLVGLGTDDSSLAAELRARGISEHVVTAGYREDVETCYAAMDISVLTSLSEGLSITLLESMRHGLATVVTDVGGNSELVVDGVTGFLVPVADRAAFVHKVVALARDPLRRRDMGEAGRRRVAEEFAIEGVARRYRQVYEEALGVTSPA